MKYSKTQLGYILYNNRSVEGVVQNFLKSIEMDPKLLIEIESQFEWSKNLYTNLERMVEVDVSLLDPEADDEIIQPNELDELTKLVEDSIGKFNESELNFLTSRGIDDSIIMKWSILGLSNFTEYESLRRIGATCHPILRNFLKDGIEDGGIVIPLFEGDKLVNCAIRRLNDVGKLKYTLAVPDIPVWGLDFVEDGDEIWICEGLFDMMALNEFGNKCVSPSSAMWSGIQLYKILEKKPKFINILCDNDRVGLKNGIVLTKFFNIRGIPSKTYHSLHCKDAAEHLFEKKLSLDDIVEIRITRDMVSEKVDNSFDFLKYLQKRKF